MNAAFQPTDPSVDHVDQIAFEDLVIGQTAEIRHEVSEEGVRTFAHLTGDTNPIHLSEAYAANTRFGGRIAHGLYTASLISAVLGTKLPGPGAVYLSQTMKFRAPVRLGDVVVTQVEITALDPGRQRATFFCTCSVGDKVVLDGEAQVMVPSRSEIEAELA
ncbi:(R)-specific enoyl-CoA hydratase [Methylopila jiangsuensis]|uniref:(R)-specific enoyl-CoA hydratase n=1 Tax=Methylopila jiangsuensis TaxID=586230 RepID=A0A9W6JD86_9HYPH|nr:MaoC family dehydratase [Methylopila jiangsuensis]MDR6287292.1 3-hydroxybutyryl-CoA dehydratase [Methylopila jiangsuensis]GLK74872.1 (R)-specific enoyl-CoA hydratase [Methylopila jiangsuensis]